MYTTNPDALTSQQQRALLKEHGYQMIAVRYPQIDGSVHRTLVYYTNGHRTAILEILMDAVTRIEQECTIYIQAHLQRELPILLDALPGALAL